MVQIQRSTYKNLPSGTLGLTPTTKSATSSKILVDENVNNAFADSVIKSFNTLEKTYDNTKVKNLIILSKPDKKQIEEMENLSNGEKQLLMSYIEDDAKKAYGFYSEKAKSFVIIESNHARKDKSLEGTLAQQGADTITHEFGHLVGNKKSESKTFRTAYLEDLKNLYKKLKENKNEKIANSNMSYEEALEYFKHYIEGTDFSDGINEKDVTARGARENYAEAFSIINDKSENKSNEIFRELFPNSINTVALSCIA